MKKKLILKLNNVMWNLEWIDYWIKFFKDNRNDPSAEEMLKLLRGRKITREIRKWALTKTINMLNYIYGSKNN